MPVSLGTAPPSPAAESPPARPGRHCRRGPTRRPARRPANRRSRRRSCPLGISGHRHRRRRRPPATPHCQSPESRRPAGNQRPASTASRAGTTQELRATITTAPDATTAASGPTCSPGRAHPDKQLLCGQHRDRRRHRRAQATLHGPARTATRADHRRRHRRHPCRHDNQAAARGAEGHRRRARVADPSDTHDTRRPPRPHWRTVPGARHTPCAYRNRPSSLLVAELTREDSWQRSTPTANPKSPTSTTGERQGAGSYQRGIGNTSLINPAHECDTTR